MMMKDEILKILPKPPEQIRVAYIMTAVKTSIERGYAIKDRKALVDLGMQIEDIDIEGKDENELMEILKNFDVIFVQGGNPFYFLNAVCESGFQKVAEEMIEKGKIYIGQSAGSMLAGPTIETGLWKRKDRERYGVTDMTGMNWIDFNIFPHYKEEYKSIVDEEVAKSKYPVKILTNDQAILIQDDKMTLLDNNNDPIIIS